MTNSVATARPRQREANPPRNSFLSELGFAALVILAFPATLAFWLAFDYSYPMWDAASHIHDSIKYENLFRHPRFWSGHWITEFLSVNPAYPMTVHAINGLLKAIFGIGRFTEGLSLIMFSITLSASVYATARMLFGTRLAAAFCVLIINCYPLVSLLSHFPMLDFPQLSLTCLATMTLVWWQQKPTYLRAVFTGIAVSLAVTTKQTAALYLVGPCAYLFVSALWKKQFFEVKQLLIIGAIAASGLALWVLPNLTGLKKYLDYNGAACQTNRSLFEIFSSNCSAYLGSMPESMSPLLLLLALISIAYLSWNERKSLKQLLLPSIAATTGVILMSLQSCNNPEPRYIIPVLLLPALASGAALSNMCSSKAGAGVVAIVAVIISAQFALFNFSPYPIQVSVQQREAIKSFAGHPTIPGKMEPSYNPTPNEDVWRQRWVLQSISKVGANSPTSLNILPSTPELSPHTLNLAAVYENVRVECSTFRQYTIRGDIVRFDPKAIESYQWYLMKTGFQGFCFKDAESENNYLQISRYVESSDKFYRAATTELPDGSQLHLYKHR